MCQVQSNAKRDEGIVREGKMVKKNEDLYEVLTPKFRKERCVDKKIAKCGQDSTAIKVHWNKTHATIFIPDGTFSPCSFSFLYTLVMLFIFYPVFCAFDFF